MTLPVQIRLLSTALIFLGLTACASRPLVIHNPAAMPADQLVKVTGFQSEFHWLTGPTGYSASIKWVWDEAGNEITKRSQFWDEVLSEFTLAPGKYKFSTLCTRGDLSASPEAVFELAASKRYELYCEIGKGENFLGMKVDAFAEIKIRELGL